MDGHIYTVCAKNDFANSKCGYTTQDVWPYLQNNYARTMVPMTIRKVMQVPYARLAESMLFCAMDSYRKVANHEVFDVDDETLTQSYHSVKLFFDTLTASQPSLTKCTFVQPPAPSRKRNLSGLSVNQIAKQAAAERKKQRVDAYNLRMQQEQQEYQLKEAKIEKLLTSFISTICSTSPNLKVGSVALLAAYNKFAPEIQLSSTDFNAKMKAKGFIKKVVSIHGILMQGFVGLSLKS